MGFFNCCCSVNWSRKASEGSGQLSMHDIVCDGYFFVFWASRGLSWGRLLFSFRSCFFEVSSRDGVMEGPLASHQCDGLDSRTRRHMWVEFVGSLLCSHEFFSGYSGFPLSSKTNVWCDLYVQCTRLVPKY